MKQSTRMPFYGPFFRNALVTLAVAGPIAAPAWGGGLREVDQTIFGMDCAPCAAGIEMGLKKLDGVTSVRVSLNEGKAILAFESDSDTSLAQVQEVIRHNGFTPKEAVIKLVGRVGLSDGQLWIDSGSDRFHFKANDSAVQDLAAKAATSQEITAFLRIAESGSDHATASLISRE